ncbi:hypothetical protein H9X96_03135 [Pedobacter sp. N36a]|uniref:hypothetical protein n=1 Tax=Pedobacter sp. N36a TaxID=2767996 RepID=UPI001656DAC4|nr:hypothetical protein [Pedobacter sp. N36a]MBC8984764.1 hypothetical protein [Pedobacter sp. N36a]
MTYCDRSYIIPHNPNTCTGDGFEGFRQSMNAITHLWGEWPKELKTVPRGNVELRWTEFDDECPFTDPTTMKTTWLVRKDVQEYAYYVGPAKEKGVDNE